MNSFKEYLNESKKKEKAEKEKKVIAVSGSGSTPGNSPDVVPGAIMGNVVVPQQPPVDNIEMSALSTESQGNLEAYNVIRAFGMNMENNLPSVVLLKSHPTPEIAKGATLLEKDIRAVIEYIMNMQIPL